MDESPAASPVTPQSLITEENVKKALAKDKGKDAKFLSMKVVDFTKKGDNYACVVSSAEVEYSANGKTETVTYVVKLNPCRGFADFEFFNEMFFKKESKFYMELIPELNSVLSDYGIEALRFPKFYHAELDKLKQQIYLEDMRQRGFKMYDKRKGMNVAHAELVLKELAKLHAASILMERKNNQKAEEKYGYLLEDFLDIKANETMLPFFEDYVNTAVSMLKKVGGYERAITWAENMKLTITDIFPDGLYTDKFNVINHGDCWNNNTIFKYDDNGEPVDVILLDLQICRKASLAVDLNYFFYSSFNGDVRKENLDHFLSLYYDNFKKVFDEANMAMFFTLEELKEEFRNKNALGGFFCMMVVPLVLLESEDVPDISGHSEEDVQRLMAEMKASALDLVDKNPNFHARFLSMFDEFMETGLIAS